MECLCLWGYVFWSGWPDFNMPYPPLPILAVKTKKVLGTDVSPDDALSVARFYEQQHELGKAGKFYR